MPDQQRRSPALDLFWEEADLNDSAEHPLRRELAHRVDVLARYERLIADAQSTGHDDLLSNLTAQHRRELGVVEALQAALSRGADVREKPSAEEPPLSSGRETE